LKPTGPSPPTLAAPGPLRVAGKSAETWIEEAGDTPLFLYDFDAVDARVARLRAALPEGVAIHYAVKANPYPPLVQAMARLVDGLDVASAGELALASAAMSPDRISFAGPGKRDDELSAAIATGATINLESEGEAERALRIAKSAGKQPRLAVRVNPSFELRGSGMRMGGRPSPFGIDAARVPALIRRLAEAGGDYRGLHVFAGSQSLDTAALIETQRQTIALVAELSHEAGVEPPLVNLGGGFGIPYFAGDRPVDVEAIGTALAESLTARPSVLAASSFAIELGRWLVGEAGVYLTRIVDRKESGGEIFLICDGGLNHQLAATGNLGTVVRRNYPVALARDVLGAPEETVSIVGPLCTPLDRLADRVALPRAEVGDVIAVFASGAYGATASPGGFLGHPAVGEMVV
jgi:diaminopimelate decarboxylase